MTLTVVVTASGAPGTAALLRALRENGEREVRLVGTDMSERSIGRHLCDAFHVVPRGSDPAFADAVLAVAPQRGAPRAILPQSSFDPARPRRSPGSGFKPADGVAVLVASPGAVRRANDKAESLCDARRDRRARSRLAARATG